MTLIWEAPQDVCSVVNRVLQENHCPRLAEAKVAVSFEDSKPFVQNQLNLGKVTKFSNFNRLWQKNPGYDFSIVICSDVWHSVLTGVQRKALVDLHLSCCTVEYEPQIVVEGRKRKVIKDEWGRIQYTDEVKLDDVGRPKWKVAKLNLSIIADNIRRYGAWFDELLCLKDAIVASPEMDFQPEVMEL